MTEQSIGVIGCGNMGGRIARRLVETGADVVGYDSDPAQLERFGIPPASSISELVRGRAVVFCSLPNSRIVESVVLGPDGVHAHATGGQVVVDLSTSSPMSSRRIHAVLAEQKVAFIDAGVSGGPGAARRGKLTLMAGGDEAALAGIRWAIDPFCATVYYMGAPGAGHTTKLLNNFLNAVSLSSAAEAMIAARVAGLDLHKFLDVINHSTGQNHATLHRFPYILDGNYLEGGLTVGLMLKDLLLYEELADDLSVATFNAAGSLATYRAAKGLGYNDLVSNRVVDALGDLAGGARVTGTQPTTP
jgi:3-hydroxyisobutyrate dehydrogenase